MLWISLVAVSTIMHLFLAQRAGGRLHAVAHTDTAGSVRIRLDPGPSSRTTPVQPDITDLRFDPPPEMQPQTPLEPSNARLPLPSDVFAALRGSDGGDTPGSAVRAGFSAPPALSGPLAGGHGLIPGPGNARGWAPSPFAERIAEMRAHGLDVVFVIDATGSMQWVLDAVKQRMADLVDTLRALVADVRFGVVIYRDGDDPEWTVRALPLTYSTLRVEGFLDGVAASGGGSYAEDIEAGFRTALASGGWRRDAVRMVLIVGDAPPHRDSLDRILAMALAFARNGGTVSTLDVSHEANPELVEVHLGRRVNHALYRGEPLYEFLRIAEAGAGRAATLDGDLQLVRRILLMIVGDRFAAELDALLGTFGAVH
jgi:hypothetical protein